MASLVRTKLAIVLLINCIVLHNCDYDVETGEARAELLLQGDEDTLEEENPPFNQNIEPDRFLIEYPKEPISNIEPKTTTEAQALQTTTYENELNPKDDMDYYDVKTEETTMPEVTEDATDNATIDNTVDRTDEDIYATDNNGTSTAEPQSKVESTSSTTATTGADDVEAQSSDLAGFDDEQLSQRAPKTENSEPKQQDKRNFEPKPFTTPALSKSSTLKSWLEDSWLRPPAGILVPLRPMALNRALAVWNDLNVEGLNVTDIVIVGYDSNGVNWRSRHNLQPSSSSVGDRTVAEALSKLLLKYQGVDTDSMSDGTMRALASAAKLVPYDSALFVITDRGPGDLQRLPLALRALVEKRLKVYTIWTEPDHPSEESEKQLEGLRNVSKHTEGDVLPYSLQVMDMDGSNSAEMQQWETVVESQPQARKGRVNAMVDDEFDTLLVRRGRGKVLSLGVPVENGVVALRIFIEGLVEHAVLYPPNEAPQIDLYNVTSVLAFSPKSRTDGLSPRDVYLAFPGADSDMDTLTVLPMRLSSTDAPAPTVGTWHLSVRCDTCDYRICVTARALIHFQASVEPKDMLKIRVDGPVSSVRESALIDEYGIELAKLPFSYQPLAADGQEMHQPEDGRSAELAADVNMGMVKGSKVYAKIEGRDFRGQPFVRLSGPLNQEVRMGRSASIAFPDQNDLEEVEMLNSKVYNQKIRYNETSVLPYNRAVSQVVNQRGSLLTSVQIGLSTKLYGAPGDDLQLHFEVTNYREQSVSFNFGAIGELKFLTGINPSSQTISSGQTVNVIVSAKVAPTAQPGARDLITFTAYGIEQVSISAYIYVNNPGQPGSDVWAPEIRNNFQGTCIGRLGDDCAQHVWSATIIARDAIGGLLRLSSSPIGLIYDSNFISGSREEVMAIYRATCCAPRVVVTAVDAYGNANSYVVDISSKVNAVDAYGNANSYVVDISNYLTEAGIAAIVLGVFLLIAIIAIIVFLIYWCVKRRQESKDLPYMTSTRNVS